jgi:DNA sulfur modification protein DndB
MSEYCFDIPAVRGIQAGGPFYTINAPFGVLQRLVAFDTGNVLARSLREVNPTRAKKISQYIQSNPDSYVLTSLTGVINEQPEFIESEYANVGLLKVSMDSEIINSTLHVTTAKLLFYMVLFVVTLLKIIDHFKSNLKYKIISLNSDN